MKPCALVLGLLIASLGRPALARSPQDPCRAPAPAESREPNMFTPAQESDLGDAVAERFEPFLSVIENDALTTHLRQVGERLVSHLPPTDLRFQFNVMDIPEANAFVLPGGRIYVSRKLIGFARSEDELAGVLGHELGHLVARQQAIEMTRRLREVIGVTDVGDRRDIFDKYNRLMDNAGRKPSVFRTESREDRDQIEADRIGLFVVAAAGYDPHAHVTMFDRFAETQGNTGSFLSRMFGTNPDAKRLAELIKNAAVVPAGCAGPQNRAADARAYEAWQSAVVSFSGLGRAEALHGVISKTALTPALRGEVTHLRFSQDGRYVLAQDDAGIAVLSRDPFAVWFRIESSDAEPAEFTPDSQDVIFTTAGLRVERWHVADRKLINVQEVVRRKSCAHVVLAPDGRTVMCIDSDADLWLIDVASAATLFQKKAFYRSDSFGGYVTAAGHPYATARFSPDSRYFAIGYRDLFGDVALVYDLTAHAAVNLKGAAKKLVTAQFAFVGPDRLVGLNPDEPAKSGLVHLPDSAVLEQFAIPRGDLTATTKGNYLLVRPYEKYAVGLLDLATRTVVKGNAMDAFDVSDQAFVAERGTGDLGLYNLQGNQVIATAALPAGALARVRATAVSSDFQWLAVSERSRGAVWDLARRERVAHIRGFAGAYFDETDQFFADLPKAGSEPRAMMRLSPALRQVASAGEIKDLDATQLGQWLVVSRRYPPNTRAPQGIEYEVRDVRRPAPMWSRSFKAGPPDVWAHSGSDTVVFSWIADSPAGREEIRKDPALRNSVKLGDIAGDYILEIVDVRTGASRRRMLLETGKGSFGIEEIFTAGDWMMVTDTIGRVLVYSLATGDLKGHAFGMEPIANPGAGLLVVDAGGGRLVLYDLETMHRRDALSFTQPVPLKALSPDGTRLFVLTADQVAYVLDVSR